MASLNNYVVFAQALSPTGLLAEIGDLPPGLQVKLLRVLQEKVLERIGDERSMAVDVRVLCATHRDLRAEVQAGRFRQDLYFRLAVLPIRTPALPERLEDLPELTLTLLAAICAEEGRGPLHLRADALAAIAAQPWHGNVREYRNALVRGALASLDHEITAAGLGLEAWPEPVAGSPGPQDGRPPASTRLTRAQILEALQHTAGNRRAAARHLGVAPDTLYRMLAKLGIGPKSGPGGA